MGDEQAFGVALRQVKEAGLTLGDQVRLCAIGDGASWRGLPDFYLSLQFVTKQKFSVNSGTVALIISLE